MSGKLIHRILSEMSEEEQIRELCARVTNGREVEITCETLRLALIRYLEDESDEVLIADLLEMPDVAPVLTNRKHAA